MAAVPLQHPAVAELAPLTLARRKKLGNWVLPSTWAMAYRLLKGKPLRFRSKRDPHFHRPWMIGPMDDMAPVIAVQKARQMGFTECFLTKMFYMASLIRTRAIYTMPKWDKAREIAKTRIEPLGLNGHPDSFQGEVLQRMSINWRALMYKEVIPLYGGGTSEILVVGSFNEDLGESTAADQVYLDEYDRMRPGVISAFRECLSASKVRQLRIFSTPTLPKTGIDGQYNLSDRRRWMYKCPRCGHWQHLTFDNIVQCKGPTSLMQRLEAHDETAKVPDGTFDLVCMKCRQHLDRWQAHAQWVAEAVEAEIRGYKVSQLDCVWITADAVMRKQREYRPIGAWWNYVIGEAYLGEVGELLPGFSYHLIDATMRFRCREDFSLHFPGQTRVAVGIDWGKTNWVMVLGVAQDYTNPILLEIAAVHDTANVDDTVEAAANIAAKWQAEVVVADMGYGQDRNPKLHKKLHCPFWGCMYPRDGTTGATVEPMFRETPITGTSIAPFPVVKVGRAPSLKERRTELSQGFLTISNIAELEHYIDLLDAHFRNVAVTVEELADGSKVESAQTTGPDHLLHAYNYAKVGLEWIRTHQLNLIELDQPNSVRKRDEAESLGMGLPCPEDLEDLYDLFGE